MTGKGYYTSVKPLRLYSETYNMITNFAINGCHAACGVRVPNKFYQIFKEEPMHFTYGVVRAVLFIFTGSSNFLGFPRRDRLTYQQWVPFAYQFTTNAMLMTMTSYQMTKEAFARMNNIDLSVRITSNSF